MPTSVKVFLDTRSYSEKNEGHPIKLRVQNSGNKLISLFKYSDQEHWRDGLLKSHPNYRLLNDFLKKRELQLVEEVAYCNNNDLNLADSYKVIKEGINDNNKLKIFLLQQEIDKLKGKSGIGLLEFFDVRAKELLDTGNESNSRAYTNTRKQIQYYTIVDIPLTEVTRSFVINFSAYKLKDGCGSQGLRYYLVQLSALFNEAIRRTELNILTNPVKGLLPAKRREKELSVPNKEQALSIFNLVKPEKITEYNFKRTKKRMAIFEFQFLIGGHNLVDVALLRWTDIVGGRLKFSRYKNRKKTVVVIENIIIGRAREIIKEYGTKDSDRIFSFIPSPIDELDAYINYRALTGKALRRNFNFKVSTNSARFMFRTYGGELGIDKLILMQLQGHKSKEITFAYQQRLPDKMIDEALLRIIKLD